GPVFYPRHSGPVFRESCQSVARRRLPSPPAPAPVGRILRLGAGSRRYLLGGGSPWGEGLLPCGFCQAGLDCFGPRNPGAGGGCPGKRGTGENTAPRRRRILECRSLRRDPLIRGPAPTG